MEITRDMLEELAWEELHMCAKRLRFWTLIAEEELKKETLWEPLYGLLFWAKVEFHRRRVYLAEAIPEVGKETPEVEERGSQVLLKVEERRREEYEKRKKAQEP